MKFSATLTLVASDAGGRRTPIRSGYRATVCVWLRLDPLCIGHRVSELAQFEQRCGSALTTLEQDVAWPGTEATAHFTIVRPATFSPGLLVVGKQFELREGERVVAIGRIRSVED